MSDNHMRVISIRMNIVTSSGNGLNIGNRNIVAMYMNDEIIIKALSLLFIILA